jgi:hypothetical protein
MRFANRPSLFIKAGAGALLTSLAVLYPGTALAQNKLALDLGADFPSHTGNDNGWGAGIRFGRQWNLTLIKLTPEVGFSYHDLSGPADTTAWNILAGGRFGIDFGLEPLIYAHAGVGHYSSVGVSQTSFAYDIGAALDLTMLPVVTFGAHVTEAGIAGSGSNDAFNWLEVGGHVAFTIGG